MNVAFDSQVGSEIEAIIWQISSLNILRDYTLAV